MNFNADKDSFISGRLEAQPGKPSLMERAEAAWHEYIDT